MNILIIRPGAIGDTLLTFPIMKALKVTCTNPHITFVGNAAVLPLTQACGLADQVSDYQSPQWSALFSSAAIQAPSLRAILRETDLAIGWLRDPDHLVERNLREASARQIIIAPGRPPQGQPVHIIDYLASTIGIKGAPGALHIDGAGIEGPRSAEGRPIIAIHPGSGGERKCWPLERFAEVIEWSWRRRWSVL